MPHIVITSTDITRNIKTITVDIKVEFSNEYYKSAKCSPKLEELEEEFLKVVEKYLPNACSYILTNHEFNIIMNEY